MKLLKIAVLSLALATPLAAQQTEPYVHLFSDEGISARLAESGYSDIMVTRDGTKLTINATRDGAAHTMVYDMTTGALVELDGAGYSLGTPPGVVGGGHSEGKSD